MKKPKFKSKLEEKVNELLVRKKLALQRIYEVDTFTYTVPASEHKYTPDFKISKNRYIEVKGRLTLEDRKKLLLVRSNWRNSSETRKLQLFLLFSNSKNKLYKTSNTTYGNWATKNGFEWADLKDGIPDKWFK